jgi:hypothetical protein
MGMAIIEVRTTPANGNSLPPQAKPSIPTAATKPTHHMTSGISIRLRIWSPHLSQSGTLSGRPAQVTKWIPGLDAFVSNRRERTVSVDPHAMQLSGTASR